MNTLQDQLCVDVLAAITWADGEVSEAELEKAARGGLFGIRFP